MESISIDDSLAECWWWGDDLFDSSYELVDRYFADNENASKKDFPLYANEAKKQYCRPLSADYIARLFIRHYRGLDDKPTAKDVEQAFLGDIYFNVERNIPEHGCLGVDDLQKDMDRFERLNYLSFKLLSRFKWFHVGMCLGLKHLDADLSRFGESQKEVHFVWIQSESVVRIDWCDDFNDFLE